MNLTELIRASKRVYLCGNGGSAANALHIANDLISVGVKAHALTGDVATLTAIANDDDYGFIFSKQVRVFCEPGDLLIVLSGSGNSTNIVNALMVADDLGITSYAIIGAFNEHTHAEQVATHTIKLGLDMQEAEEHQLILGHQVLRELKEVV